jgi:hypothetical protein
LHLIIEIRGFRDEEMLFGGNISLLIPRIDMLFTVNKVLSFILILFVGMLRSHPIFGSCFHPLSSLSIAAIPTSPA